ncbi:MAG: T9SS type A sorting domain-containing protein [Bacteroidota bacterium]
MTKVSTPFADKLRTYQRTSVDTTSPNTRAAKESKLKSTLLTLAPFAAGALMMPTSAQAQCGQGTAVFNSTGGAYGDGQLDVDGDGNPDFDFDIASNGLFITPIGTMSVGLATTNYVNYLGLGATITTTSPPAGFGTGSFGFVQISSGGYFNNGTAAFAYIPIIDASGNLGFIRYTKDGVGGFTIDITQTGISDTGGDPVVTGSCGTLPVELISFSATPEPQAVALQWKTASEINNSGFEVERSTDGVNFYKIGWVEGEGKSNREVTYKYVDQEAMSNTTYYYRLRQVDFDGKYEYSNVETVEINDKNINIRLFPNPSLVSESVQLRINADSDISGQVELFDMSGRLVQSTTLGVQKGENAFELTTKELSSGTYIVKMQLGDVVKYEKLMLE